MMPRRTLSSSGGSGSNDSSAFRLPDSKQYGLDLGVMRSPNMSQLYMPRNFIEVSAGPLQVSQLVHAATYLLWWAAIMLCGTLQFPDKGCNSLSHLPTLCI